jgi:hypothetical protein
VQWAGLPHAGIQIQKGSSWGADKQGLGAKRVQISELLKKKCSQSCSHKRQELGPTRTCSLVLPCSPAAAAGDNGCGGYNYDVGGTPFSSSCLLTQHKKFRFADVGGMFPQPHMSDQIRELRASIATLKSAERDQQSLELETQKTLEYLAGEMHDMKSSLIKLSDIFVQELGRLGSECETLHSSLDEALSGVRELHNGQVALRLEIKNALAAQARRSKSAPSVSCCDADQHSQKVKELESSVRRVSEDVGRCGVGLAKLREQRVHDLELVQRAVSSAPTEEMQLSALSEMSERINLIEEATSDMRESLQKLRGDTDRKLRRAFEAVQIVAESSAI